MGYGAQISPTPSRASRLVWALAFRTAMMAIFGGIGFTASAADDQAQTSLPAANKDEPRQSGEELTEILVTARKRSEDLRDIPASIVAISDSTIVEAHMTQIDDIGALVSNLHIVQRRESALSVSCKGSASM